MEDEAPLHDVFRVGLRISSTDYLWTFRIYDGDSSHVEIQLLDDNTALQTATAATSTLTKLAFVPFCVPYSCSTMHLSARDSPTTPRVYACRFNLARRDVDGTIRSIVHVTGSLSPTSGFQGQLHPMGVSERAIFDDVARALWAPTSWCADVESVRVTLAPVTSGKCTLQGTIMDRNQLVAVVMHLTVIHDGTLSGTCLSEQGRTAVCGSWTSHSLDIRVSLQFNGQRSRRITLSGTVTRYNVKGNWTNQTATKATHSEEDYNDHDNEDGDDEGQDDEEEEDDEDEESEGDDEDAEEEEGDCQDFRFRVIQMRRVWSPLAHAYFPSSFKKTVQMCLVASLRDEDSTIRLPSELWMRVFTFCHSDWFP